MKKILILLVAVSASLFTGCQYDDDLDPPNYITFANRSASVGVPVDGSSTYEATVYTANVSGESRSFNIITGGTLGAGGFTVPASVTVPAGSNEATIMVEVSDVGLGVAGKTLTLALEKGPGLSTGSALTLNVARSCPGSALTIAFAFDGYASEVAWSLKDSSGSTIVTGGGYSNGTSSLSRSYCVSRGDYTFEVTDSFGDGLTYPNLGSITISYAGNVITTIDGNYGSGTSVDFSF